MSQTLERALRILDFVGEKPRRIGEIAEFLDVHHSTALRFLHTLRKHGFVHEMPDHHYRLGSAMFRLGFQALDGIELRSVARPFMEKLGATVGETVHLGALEDGDVVYIEKVEADHRVRLVSRIGMAGAIHATGVGKGILAFLPEDKRHALLESRELKQFTNNTLTTVEALEADLARSRERGYALDNEENEPGIHCVSAPILSGDGEVVGSMSVSTPTSRVDDDMLLSFVPALLEATEGTSRELGWTP